MVFVTSCANPGIPSGGDRDSIPPVVLKMIPEANSVNYTGNTITLSFNEYVIVDKLADQMVVSPPLPKKPVVRTKGKGIVINMGDSLRQNVTYSVDFKDGITDNNEGNPIKDFRIAFSTGPTIDTLMLGGYVYDAKNNEPVANATVLMYTSSDTIDAVKKKIPLYIAKTNEEGFYAFSNIGEGEYYLYALLEEDNSMKYDQANEKIAFLDSFVVPSFPISMDVIDMDSIAYFSFLDSLKTVNNQKAIDSLIRVGKELFMGKTDMVNLSRMIIPGQGDADPRRPGRQARTAEMTPYIMHLFEEEANDQYLSKSDRDKRNLLNFEFEARADSFSLGVVKPQLALKGDWYISEFSRKRDSISVWITDTIVSRCDTLTLEVAYMMLDSLQNPFLNRDTLRFNYFDPQVRETRRRRIDAEDVKQSETFSFNINARDNFDPYNDIIITAPEPLMEFNHEMVSLFEVVDSVKTPINIEIVQDLNITRKFYIKHNWKFESQYQLLIDSAAARTFLGVPSIKTDQPLTIQKQDYYGIITLNLKNVPGNSIVQLLKNDKDEAVVKQHFIDKDGILEIPFVHPEKYKIRLIEDSNNNKEWDTGNLDKRIQPERVVYFPKILRIRSNFDNREDWILPVDFQPKNIEDPYTEENKQSGVSRFR